MDGRCYGTGIRGVLLVSGGEWGLAGQRTKESDDVFIIGDMINNTPFL